MITRIWRGAVRVEDADAYAEYMQSTGIAGYAGTPGNRGVYMLRRDLGPRCEYLMLTLWDSLDAVKAFASEDYETDVFYPEDDRYLVERDEVSSHFEIVARVPATSRSPRRTSLGSAPAWGEEALPHPGTSHRYADYGRRR